MPAQVQVAGDVDVEYWCSRHILQQRNGRAIVFRFERIVQIAHIGGGAAIFNLRYGGDADIHRPRAVRHIVIPHRQGHAYRNRAGSGKSGGTSEG